MDQSKKCYPSNDCKSPGALGRQEPKARGGRYNKKCKITQAWTLSVLHMAFRAFSSSGWPDPVPSEVCGSSCLGSIRNWWGPLVPAAAVGNHYGFGERLSSEASLPGFHEIGCTCYAHSMKITSCWLFTFLLLRKKGVMFLYSSLMGLRPPPTVIPLVSQLVIL